MPPIKKINQKIKVVGVSIPAKNSIENPCKKKLPLKPIKSTIFGTPRKQGNLNKDLSPNKQKRPLSGRKLSCQKSSIENSF